MTKSFDHSWFDSCYILWKWRWRFCQFLWPSQKTWTLKAQIFGLQRSCSTSKVLISWIWKCQNILYFCTISMDKNCWQHETDWYLQKSWQNNFSSCSRLWRNISCLRTKSWWTILFPLNKSHNKIIASQFYKIVRLFWSVTQFLAKVYFRHLWIWQKVIPDRFF